MTRSRAKMMKNALNTLVWDIFEEKARVFNAVKELKYIHIFTYLEYLDRHEDLQIILYFISL